MFFFEICDILYKIPLHLNSIERREPMSIAYIAVFLLSLLLLPAYFAYIEKKQREPWLFGLFLCVSTTNLGYLLLSIAQTVEFALFSNKIAYLGQVFILLCMFQIISRLCGASYPKWVITLQICLAAIMFAMVCTTGYLDWYYRSVTLSYANGASKLVKEYGVLHPLYLVYVLGYFGAMLCVILRSIRKNKNGSTMLASLMLVVVFGNIGMWIVEKFIPLNFEFLSISYLMSEFVFFFVYILLQDYIRIIDLPTVQTMPAVETAPLIQTQAKSSVIFVDSKERADRVQAILASLPEHVSLSSRQMEVLEGILDGKSRKEIAADLHLSENTVKMHTSSLFKALGVSSRQEIFAMLQD